MIERDTITLRGKVVDVLGMPVPHIGLRSKATDEYNQCYLGAQTDRDGFFEIKGAYLNDTIRLEPNANKEIYFANKGSRFITIQLPPVVSAELAAEVKAKRLVPKKTSRLTKYKPSDFINCGYPNISFDASYKGGTKAFNKFIATTLKYPEEAIALNIEGSVRVSFTVSKDGSLGGFSILNRLGHGCDEEAIRVLKLSPKWTPAIRSGRPIEIEQTVSISFSLED